MSLGTGTMHLRDESAGHRDTLQRRNERAEYHTAVPPRDQRGMVSGLYFSVKLDARTISDLPLDSGGAYLRQ